MIPRIQDMTTIKFAAIIICMLLSVPKLDAQDFRRRSGNVELGYTFPFGYSTDKFETQGTSENWGLFLSITKSWRYSSLSGMSISFRPEYSERTMHKSYEKTSKSGVLVSEINKWQQLKQLRFTVPVRYDMYLLKGHLRLSPGVSVSITPFSEQHNRWEIVEYYIEYANGGILPYDPPKTRSFANLEKGDEQYAITAFMRSEYVILLSEKNKQLGIFAEFNYDLIDPHIFRLMDFRLGLNYRI
jgi:hypothetical protein